MSQTRNITLRLVSSLVLSALWASTAVAQQVPDAFTQNERLARGVNIIGYDPIWKDRSEGRFTEEHFGLIKEAGFATVRINLHPFRHMDASNQHKLSEGWLEILDWAVQHATDEGLMVILDMHEFNAMADDPDSKKDLFLSFWRQIAPRYSEAPPSVLFEILNEPSRGLTPDKWNAYLREAHEIIRATNPNRTLIIGPAHWNGIGALDDLELPVDDRNIIVTVHYYSPMEFTHQGAPWSEAHKDSVGVTWSGSDEEVQRIGSDFSKAQVWAEAHRRPIFLGEFGAYDRGDMESRVRYTAAVARTAEAFGWSWAYWQFDSDFIVYAVDAGQWVAPILGALIRSPE